MGASATASIAGSISNLEGVESGYANAAFQTSQSNYEAGFAVGYASSITTEALSFAHKLTSDAYAAGNAILQFGNSLLSSIQGVYGFLGVGESSGLVNVEGGVGISFDRNSGLGAGLEGSISVGGLPGLPFVGVGGFWSPQGQGYGFVGGFNLGPLAGERFYDAKNNQTYYGISGGEGLMGGVGFYVNGRH